MICPGVIPVNWWLRYAENAIDSSTGPKQYGQRYLKLNIFLNFVIFSMEYSKPSILYLISDTSIQVLR